MDKMLLLEDGTCFRGKSFGHGEDAFGEVVFTTSMTGYQELLTDPSFLGQMVTMTFPMIGNYGINRYDYESLKPHMSAIIVSEWCEDPSNFRMEKDLDAYLKKFRIPGLYGIDTRKLTRHIREKGAVKGCIISSDIKISDGLELIKNHYFYKDHIDRVSTKTCYNVPGSSKRVVLMDFGMKGSILKKLKEMDFDVTVVPHDYPYEMIMELNPHGVMLSNGPGDPEDEVVAQRTIKELIGKVPIFGICMGHQLLSLACGAKTKKMKFGHRGANNPVREIESGKIYLTSQNHGYEVDRESLENTNLYITYESVNDSSVEGVRHKEHKAFSVQFHPESAPGPHDAGFLFEEFKKMMEER